MIVFNHLSTLSKHGSGQRLYGLSGVRIVLGGGGGGGGGGLGGFKT